MKRSALFFLLAAMLLFASCHKNGETPVTTPATQRQTEGSVTMKPKETIPPQWPVYAPAAPLPKLQIGQGIHPYIGRGEFYHQTMAAYPLEGPVTCFQVAAGYSGALHIRADSVMLYAGTIASVDNLFQSWANSGKQLDCMIAINRENEEYITLYPEKRETDTQMRRNGSFILHGTGVGYMVPTPDFIEYKWEVLQKVLAYNPASIAFEEPELWTVSGYSPSFKEAWKEYYGEEWQDPTTSPETRLQSERLKIYLFERIITTLAERIHETHPHVKIYIATHSIVSYNAIKIPAGVNQFAALPGVDGIIAQTWSDTSRIAFKAAGHQGSYPFIESFIEYTSYASALSEGQTLFALADPKADDPNFTWSDYRKWYEDTLVASLLQQEIHRFEIFPWPDRSFLPAPADYKTTQLSVFAALEELSGKPSVLYGGTPGIFVALSDTLSWQTGRPDYAAPSDDGYFGITFPLVSAGIPIKNLSLDNLSSVAELQGVNLLLLSYDCMLPKSEMANKVLAQWVQEGGTLLVLGGVNRYQTAQGEWFTAKGQTPAENLFAHLGMGDVQIVKAAYTNHAPLTWTGDAAFAGTIENNALLRPYADFTNAFEGTGFDVILQAGDMHIGIEKTIGSGKLIAVGMASAQYSANGQAPALLRDLVTYALRDTAVAFSPAKLLTVVRGNIIAAHGLQDTHTLQGRFIDLFDAELPIITEKTILADNSALLYDLEKADLSAENRLAFTGGEIVGEVLQEEDKTVFAIQGPFNSISSTRLLGNGRYPASVQVVRNGEEVDCIARWENATASLLVQVENDPGPAEITVLWSDTPRKDDLPYVFDFFTIATNQNNEDSDFLVRTNAGVNEHLRFADLDTEIVYRFDVTSYTAPVVYLDVVQNYIIQVSDHDGGWQNVYDYSAINPEHLRDGSNRVLLPVDPAQFGFAKELWVRITNTDSTTGWGGSIYGFTIKQKIVKQA